MANNGSNKRISQFGGAVIRAQTPPDKTVLETVVDFFQDAYNPSKADDHEKIQWVQFDKADPNDLVSNPNLLADISKAPLILTLGYTNGVQVWLVKTSGEAQEVLSLRQGPVRMFRLLPSSVSSVFKTEDKYRLQRPLAAICDTSSGQTFNSVRFVSLKSGEVVHSLPFPASVCDVKANERVVVVTLTEKLIVHDACEFKQLFWVNSCYPSPAPTPCPIALGARWLAYADKRLVPLHQSAGGVAGETGQSYTATVISAAKTITKSLTAFGGSVASSLTGTKPVVTKKDPVVSTNPSWKPGVVTIVDMLGVRQGEVRVHEETTGDGFVAHFPAHVCDPIGMMTFDPTGTLLLTCDTQGHTFHLFRIFAHQLCSSLGAVHHLYVLHRGDTEAKVQDIAFSLDSRWVSVSTKRGTTHVFPITPYGGPVNKRTHLSQRVVNRSSRFHRSAGLDDINARVPGGRDSPVQQTASPSSSPRSTHQHSSISSRSYSNPRLPPFPHPAVVAPVTQIHSTVNIPGLSGTGVAVPASKTASAAPNVPDIFSVAACFARSSSWMTGTANSREFVSGDIKKVGESLYVMNWLGMLTEYVLMPHVKTGVEKVSDDSPVDMTYAIKAQWPLHRLLTAPELQPPLSIHNPLLLAAEALQSHKATDANLLDEGLTRNASKDSLSFDHGLRDDECSDWMSEVEMMTHEGPNRRLWMGPQFSFKTLVNSSTSSPAAPVLTPSSGALLSQGISEQRLTTPGDTFSDELELQSLKLMSYRSSPVTMPGGLGKKRSFSGGSDGCSSPAVAMLIEAGSYEPPPSLWLMEVMTQEGEEEGGGVSDILADALKESPCNERFFTGREREYSDNLSTSSGSSHSVPRVQSFDIRAENVLVFPDHT